MSETPPKDGESFFRKVVRFVANPATDWADLNSRQDGDGRELDLEKSELKAMIERKKRNDFVRKREFDMLRKVRREGLSPEQLQAMAGTSRIDSESKGEGNPLRQNDSAVKAKIDEIEQQMVGDMGGGPSPSSASQARRAPSAADAVPTERQVFSQTTTRPGVMTPSGDEVSSKAPLTFTTSDSVAPRAPAAARPAPAPLPRSRRLRPLPRARRLRPLQPHRRHRAAACRCPWADCRAKPPATSPARSRSRSARSCTTPNSTSR